MITKYRKAGNMDTVAHVVGTVVFKFAERAHVDLSRQQETLLRPQLNKSPIKSTSL